MPRPEYIARLHGSLYDLRTCDPEERPEMLRRYRAALEEAAKLAGCSQALLLDEGFWPVVSAPLRVTDSASNLRA